MIINDDQLVLGSTVNGHWLSQWAFSFTSVWYFVCFVLFTVCVFTVYYCVAACWRSKGWWYSKSGFVRRFFVTASGRNRPRKSSERKRTSTRKLASGRSAVAVTVWLMRWSAGCHVDCDREKSRIVTVLLQSPCYVGIASRQLLRKDSDRSGRHFQSINQSIHLYFRHWAHEQ